MRLSPSNPKVSLLLAIALFLVASNASPQQNELKPNGLVGENHSLSLDSVRLDKFSTSGAASYVLEAIALKQNSYTGISDIDSPIIKFEDLEGTSWQVKARKGRLYKPQIGAVLSDEVLHLSGKVLIIRSSLSNQKLQISSEHFFLFPSKNYGETMSPVTVTSLTTTTKAANLTVDLQLGEIKLESNSAQTVETKILYAQAEK